MTELVCIICPKGCTLLVDEENDFSVCGQGCKRGEAYGKEEVQHPVRTLTATVCITGAVHRRCPVKLTKPIEKHLLCQAAMALQTVCLKAPIQQGAVVLCNVLGTGADCVATKSMEEATI